MGLDTLLNTFRTWRLSRAIKNVSLAATPVAGVVGYEQVAYADDTKCTPADACEPPLDNSGLFDATATGKKVELPPPDTSGTEPYLTLQLLGRLPMYSFENKSTGTLESSRSSIGPSIGLGVNTRLVVNLESFGLLAEIDGYYAHNWITTSVSPEGNEGGESGTIKGTEHDLGLKLKLVPGYHVENVTIGVYLEGSGSIQLRDFEGTTINTATGDSFPETDTNTNSSLEGRIGGHIGVGWGGGKPGRQTYSIIVSGGWGAMRRVYDNAIVSSTEGGFVGLRLHLDRVLLEGLASFHDNVTGTYGDGVPVKATGMLWNVDAKISVEAARDNDYGLLITLGYKGKNYPFVPESGSQATRNNTVHNPYLGVGMTFK